MGHTHPILDLHPLLMLSAFSVLSFQRIKESTQTTKDYSFWPGLSLSSLFLGQASCCVVRARRQRMERSPGLWPIARKEAWKRPIQLPPLFAVTS